MCKTTNVEHINIFNCFLNCGRLPLLRMFVGSLLHRVELAVPLLRSSHPCRVPPLFWSLICYTYQRLFKCTENCLDIVCMCMGAGMCTVVIVFCYYLLVFVFLDLFKYLT